MFEAEKKIGAAFVRTSAAAMIDNIEVTEEGFMIHYNEKLDIVYRYPGRTVDNPYVEIIPHAVIADFM